MAQTRNKARPIGWNALDGEAMASMFPTPTAGDGRIKANNIRPGKNQPDARPSPRRKASCMQCGFLADHSKHANDGGNLEATGGGGKITAVDGGDGTVAGEQQYRTGASCPFCFSRNWSIDRRVIGI